MRPIEVTIRVQLALSFILCTGSGVYAASEDILVAHNDLRNFTVENLKQMRAIGSTVDPQCTVLNYNICTLNTLYGTRLDPKHRLPKIVQQIKEIDADIVCLQESRKQEAQYLCKALIDLGYAVELAPVNGTPEAATLITAYKESSFFCADSKRWWYQSENPNQCGGNDWYKWGRILTAVRLQRLTSEGMPDYKKSPLCICNTHLGVKRDEKTFSIKLALELLEAHQGDKPTLWCGDFNFFEDDGGADHRALITQAGYTDLLEQLTDTEGNALSGTFVGYSPDSFKPKNLDSLSKLDGIFVRGVHGKAARCLTAIRLAQDLHNRDELPSDHLPVSAQITY